MKDLYTKVILYSYPCLEKLVEQIDVLVEKKAYSSMDNFEPAIEISKEILSLTEQKKRIIQLFYIVSDVLDKFTKDELDCLEYRYFKRKPKEYFKDFDSVSRGYFRKQIRNFKKFSELIERFGYSDSRVEADLLNIKFFNELTKRLNKLENEKKLIRKIA